MIKPNKYLEIYEHMIDNKASNSRIPNVDDIRNVINIPRPDLEYIRYSLLKNKLLVKSGSHYFIPDSPKANLLDKLNDLVTKTTKEVDQVKARVTTITNQVTQVTNNVNKLTNNIDEVNKPVTIFTIIEKTFFTVLIIALLLITGYISYNYTQSFFILYKFGKNLSIMLALSISILISTVFIFMIKFHKQKKKLLFRFFISLWGVSLLFNFSFTLISQANKDQDKINKREEKNINFELYTLNNIEILAIEKKIKLIEDNELDFQQKKIRELEDKKKLTYSEGEDLKYHLSRKNGIKAEIERIKKEELNPLKILKNEYIIKKYHIKQNIDSLQKRFPDNYNLIQFLINLFIACLIDLITPITGWLILSNINLIGFIIDLIQSKKEITITNKEVV